MYDFLQKAFHLTKKVWLLVGYNIVKNHVLTNHIIFYFTDLSELHNMNQHLI